MALEHMIKVIGNPLFLYRVLKQRLGLLHFDEP
jgi:hypothetical protein